MSTTIQGNNGTSAVTFIAKDLPDQCPFCHNSIRPVPVYGIYAKYIWSVLMLCPNKACQESFIGYYANTSRTAHGEKNPEFLKRVSFGKLITRTFSDEIQNISEGFIRIYNEAYSAEQQNLLEICGVGYRKALEFLIKDYAILKHPDKQEEIESKLLAKCINDYVADDRIKKVAKRAVWLGNDETHFVRKWEDKNLEDLKKLIDLTLHWIEAEVLSASFEVDMPE